MADIGAIASPIQSDRASFRVSAQLTQQLQPHFLSNALNNLDEAMGSANLLECAVCRRMRVKSERRNEPSLRYGEGVIGHPRMGAAQQPEVAVRELTENKRLIEKDQQKRYSGGERR